MNNPEVSIITVCYNAVNTIEQTICSVLGQNYNKIEYIIVDGHSDDGTINIIKKYENKLAKFISEPDKGLYDALNKGILISNGDWIGILNCGDVFCTSSTISNIFNSDISNNIGVIYGNSLEICRESVIHKIYRAPDEKSIIPPDYRHGASFVRSDIHKKYLFSINEYPKYDYALDYHQIYRMYKSGVVFMHKNIDVIEYQKDGISNRPWRNKYLRCLIENDGKLNIHFYCKYVSYIIKAIINKLKIWF